MQRSLIPGSKSDEDTCTALPIMLNTGGPTYINLHTRLTFNPKHNGYLSQGRGGIVLVHLQLFEEGFLKENKSDPQILLYL